MQPGNSRCDIRQEIPDVTDSRQGIPDVTDSRQGIPDVRLWERGPRAVSWPSWGPALSQSSSFVFDCTVEKWLGGALLVLFLVQRAPSISEDVSKERQGE
ncbi:hypothetical protein BsWGS_22115 [Bradybaena similaris]